MLNKEQAEQIKKKIWDFFNELEMGAEGVPAIKLSCTVVDTFVKDDEPCTKT